jgi:alkanesulfonate monooxygenase
MIANETKDGLELQLLATCPQSKDLHPAIYRERVADVARWSENAGYTGILIYTDPPLIDPWIAAQVILDATERISPFIAVQPVYMHPYIVAKLVSSIGHVYGRRLYLNMVAGASRQHLMAIGDDTPHDERYERLVEYATILKRLLAGERVSFAGKYYQLENVALTPPLSPELQPRIFVSGSSNACVLAAEALDTTLIRVPKASVEESVASVNGLRSLGLRVGVIVREDADAAWRVAHERFPDERHGQIRHALAMKTSDSLWRRQLSRLGETAPSGTHPYWLVPFRNYKAFCPYLVGSYDDVGAELSRYVRAGFRTFVLDIPASEDDLTHTAIAFERALAGVEA